MDPFTGFQFDLQLPAPLVYVQGSAILSGRKTNHIVSANTLTENILRVVAYSPNGSVFSGSYGNTVSLTFDVNGTGGFYPLSLSNVIIGDTYTQNCLSDYYNGNLEVAAPYFYSSTSLDFGDVSVLRSSQMPLRVYNFGTDTLKITSFQLSNSAFALLTPIPINILPGNYSDLEIKFQQPTKGLYNGILKISTNDPVRPIYKVSLTGTAFAPNYLKIPDLICRNIDTLWIPVKVNNIEPFVGFQFDLEYPTFMQYLSGSGQLTSRSQNHTLTVQPINANKIRVIAYSLSQNPFTADTGTIVMLQFAINSTNENQVNANLNLSGTILGSHSMENIIYHTSNGLISIRYPHLLTGTIVYNNSSNTPMDSVWISLNQNGATVDSVSTATGGLFSFPNVYNGKYKISCRSPKAWGGVNGTDAIKIQRHFVGLEPISTPIRLSSADVNNSGGINATDAVKIKRRFVGLDTVFVKADWLFENISGSDTVVMGSTNTFVNINALCTGDVNGSFNPELVSKTGQNIIMTSQNKMPVAPNQQVYLPMMLDKESEMGAISLVLKFPQDLVEIEEVQFIDGQPYYSVNDGILKIVWSEIEGVKINKDEPFAFIRLKTKSLFAEDKLVEFTNASSLTELADNSGIPVYGVNVVIPSLTYLMDSPPVELKVYPNPASNRTFLFFNSIENGLANVKIIDILGRNVLSLNSLQAIPGLNKIDIDVSSLQRNVYMISFELNSENQNVKEVKKIFVGN